MGERNQVIRTDFLFATIDVWDLDFFIEWGQPGIFTLVLTSWKSFMKILGIKIYSELSIPWKEPFKYNPSCSCVRKDYPSQKMWFYKMLKFDPKVKYEKEKIDHCYWCWHVWYWWVGGYVKNFFASFINSLISSYPICEENVFGHLIRGIIRDSCDERSYFFSFLFFRLFSVQFATDRWKILVC